MSKKTVGVGAGIATAGCVLILAFIAFIYFLSTAITMAVWNWALVPLFHLPPLDWGQAFLIYLGIGLIGGAFKSVASK